MKSIEKTVPEFYGNFISTGRKKINNKKRTFVSTGKDEIYWF